MKKIKNIKELEAKERQLEQRRSELEKAIKYDAKDLADSLKPANVSKQVISAVFDKKENNGGRIIGFVKQLRGIPENLKKWMDKFGAK